MTAGEIDAWLKKPQKATPQDIWSASPGPTPASRPSTAPPLPEPTEPETMAARPRTSADSRREGRSNSSGRKRSPRSQALGLGGLGSLPPFLRPTDPSATFIYEPGTIKNSNVFERKPPPEGQPNEAQPTPLSVGDSFTVRLHSGLSSLSNDNVVLAQVTKAVYKDGLLVIPRRVIIRGSIRTYGEQRFFLEFGQFTVENVLFAFEGRAEERNYAGIVAIRREATLQERQRSTVIDGVLSGLVGASAVAAQALPPGVREASQVIAGGTRENTLREEEVREGFVLEAAKGKHFRILVTK